MPTNTLPLSKDLRVAIAVYKLQIKEVPATFAEIVKNLPDMTKKEVKKGLHNDLDLGTIRVIDVIKDEMSPWVYGISGESKDFIQRLCIEKGDIEIRVVR